MTQVLYLAKLLPILNSFFFFEGPESFMFVFGYRKQGANRADDRNRICQNFS